MKNPPTEIFDCERVNSYLESYLLDQVPPPERRGMRLHIHRCENCFRKVTERDPLQIFAPLCDEERTPEQWEGFWDVIEEGIASAPTPGTRPGWLEGLRASFSHPRFAMAAAGALVLLAAVVVGTRLLTPVSEAPDATPPSLVTPPVVARSVVEETTPLPQTVEWVHSTHPVQVYSMAYRQNGPHADAPAPGEPPRVTELILIVDAELEL